MSAKYWSAWCIYATKTDYLHIFTTLAVSRKDAIKLWEVRTQESWKVWHAAGLHAVKLQIKVKP